MEHKEWRSWAGTHPNEMMACYCIGPAPGEQYCPCALRNLAHPDNPKQRLKNLLKEIEEIIERSKI